MKTKYVLWCALPFVLAGCGGPKSINHAPTISWIVVRSGADKAEAFKNELAEWFTPFEDSSQCEGVRFYPQVDVLKSINGKETREKLVAVSPEATMTKLQNTAQKLFGMKPKFDRVADQAARDIQGNEITEKQAQFLNAPAGHDALVQGVLRKPHAMIAFAGVDANVYARELGRVKSAHSENEKVAVNLVTGVAGFRSALAKAACTAAKAKQPSGSILLVDGSALGQETVAPPPRAASSNTAAPSNVAVNPGRAPSVTTSLTGVAVNASKTTRTATTPAVQPMPLETPPSRETDCMPGSAGCEKFSTADIRKN